MNEPGSAEQVTRRFLDGILAGDEGVIRSTLGDDAVLVLPRPSLSGTTIAGGDNLARALVELRSRYASPTAEYGIVLGSGDAAAAEWRLSATLAASGAEYDQFYGWFFVLRDGLIAEVREYIDTGYGQRMSDAAAAGVLERRASSTAPSPGAPSGRRLAGKTALVTGSTRGIGKAIAARFAAEGARVLVTGRTSPDGESVVESIRAAGGEAGYVRADLTVESDVRAAIDAACEQFGGLDVLVNNVTVTDVLRVGPDRRDGAVTEIETEDWESILRGGATSAFWACKHAFPAMIEAGGGSIVSISSSASTRGVRGMIGHSASKAALEALTRSVAVDGAPHGIRANSLVLGFIADTGGHEALLEDAGRGAALRGMHLTRLGMAEDVAAAALFLASDEAGFVTGISLPLDGGAGCKLG